IPLFNPQQHRALAFDAAINDPGAHSLSEVAWVLWLLGYPNQALRRLQEALALTQEASRPLSLAYVLGYAAVLYQLRRERQRVQERTEAQIALSSKQGFAHLLAESTIFQGWALAEQGQAEEGIAQMRKGLVAWQATGSEAWRPYHLAGLAEAHGRLGQIEE